MTRPALLYGTAWKEERTEECVRLALRAGFRAIDTANQRKHYHEAGVGAALAAARLPRAELWLQTKYTYQRGQDLRLPYDPRASITDQVAQSFASSLDHLGTDYLDSYVLHGPWSHGWHPQDRQAWSAMESLHAAGKTRALGVSNVDLDQLRTLHAEAHIKPTFVQNRCYARTGWDRDVRAFCRAHHIIYQGFSLLTANSRELAAPAVRALATRHRATVPQLVFAFALATGTFPLTGTTSPAHMAEDLLAPSFTLSPADVATLENLAAT